MFSRLFAGKHRSRCDSQLRRAAKSAGARPTHFGRLSRFESLEHRRMLDAGGIEWIREFSDSNVGGIFPDVAAAAGQVYVTGMVDGNISGQGPIGAHDGFLRAYDSSGVEQWTSRFGVPGSSVNPRAVTVAASGIYVVGSTPGQLPGSVGLGNSFAIKYDFSGNQLWSRQFLAGTFAQDVVADDSGIYVLVDTPSVFEEEDSDNVAVRKIDHNGNSAWTAHLGSQVTHAYSIATHSSGIYVAGYYAATDDAIVRRIDSDFSMHNLAVSDDMRSAFGVAVSDLGIVVSGRSDMFPLDAFVRMYDLIGNEVWTRQFGGPTADLAYDVAIQDSAIYVGGTVARFPSLDWDVFVRKFDVQGHELWASELATPGFEDSQSIAVDADGVYIVGHGKELVPGTPTDGDSLFLAKLDAGEIFDVSIDVKPGSDHNAINLSSQGIITVAILSTSLSNGDALDFDATQVLASSVVFAEAYSFKSALQDVDNDGDLDLILHFDVQDTNLDELYAQLVEDDVNADGMLDSSQQLTKASLFGKTLNGDALNGSDELNLFLSGRQLRDLLDDLFS